MKSPPNFEGLVLGCIEAKVWNVEANTRWKALAEIYTIHSFAPLSNLIFFSKFCQNFDKFCRHFANFAKFSLDFNEISPEFHWNLPKFAETMPYTLRGHTKRSADGRQRTADSERPTA